MEPEMPTSWGQERSILENEVAALRLRNIRLVAENDWLRGQLRRAEEDLNCSGGRDACSDCSECSDCDSTHRTPCTESDGTHPTE